MIDQFKYIKTFKKTGIDLYIYIICGNLKNNIDIIKKQLNIKNIPKKLFTKNDEDTNVDKILYTDKYEIIFYYVGNKNSCDNQKLYNIFGKAGRKMNEYESKKVSINLVGTDYNSIQNQVISYILGLYQFNDFKTNSNMKSNKNIITYFYHKKSILEKIINESIYTAIIQNEIRSLINTPANILTSETYSAYIKKNINKKIKIKILNKKELKKIGCNLILGVNQGSKNEAKMIILEYNGNKGNSKSESKSKNKNKPIVFIGKGVMFDSGGYNIKMGDFSDMKNDMAGSAVVYGLFQLLSNYSIHGHYIGILPLVENMVDSNSIRPGDILKAYNGKTVEIVDTDAEGRLIMADSLSYSDKYKPQLIFDIATLTGQAAQIFGNKSSVIMGNNNKYIQEMIDSGIKNNEKIWELPMWEEYVSLTKSNIADYKNYSYEIKAGTIMAGAFLSNFVPKDSNWIHLDIAGVDSLSHDTNMRGYGASGEILRSIFYFIKNYKLANK
jgi:leucyl aminopeptidase